MARILAISSHVAHGHVGLGAIVPALNRLGHEVIALPTVLLSNHPRHKQCAGEPVAPGKARGDTGRTRWQRLAGRDPRRADRLFAERRSRAFCSIGGGPRFGSPAASRVFLRSGPGRRPRRTLYRRRCGSCYSRRAGAIGRYGFSQSLRTGVAVAAGGRRCALGHRGCARACGTFRAGDVDCRRTRTPRKSTCRLGRRRAVCCRRAQRRSARYGRPVECAVRRPPA